jgi:hypothetical protein
MTRGARRRSSTARSASSTAQDRGGVLGEQQPGVGGGCRGRSSQQPAPVLALEGGRLLADGRRRVARRVAAAVTEPVSTTAAGTWAADVEHGPIVHQTELK